MIRVLALLLLFASPVFAGEVVMLRGSGGGAAPDDCDQYGTLLGWYKAADLPASGNISSWTDSGSNADNLAQATSDEQPVVGTLGSGKSANFDGSNDTLANTTGHSDAADVYTFATVFYMDTLTDDMAIYGASSGNDRTVRVETDGSIGTRNGGGGGIILTAASTVTTGTMYRLVMGRKSTGDYWIYLDGVDVLSGTPSNGSGLDIDQLGASQTSNYWDGDIGEVCFWNTDHEADATSIDSYLDYIH